MTAPASIDELVERALPGRVVRRRTVIGEGRGVFSVVHRVQLDDRGEPTSVVVKRPAAGPNGAAAARSGAYRREAFCYRVLLPVTPVAAPVCHLVADEAADRSSFVLEDLTGHRTVDQLDGLSGDDAAAAASELSRLHRHWRGADALHDLAVRRSAPSAFHPEALQRGRTVLSQRWGHVVHPTALTALDAALARRVDLVDAFAAAGPLTLCHGDPRADNLVFDDAGRAVLYDWQQVAVQFPEADLAWLTATSLDPEVRRQVERDLVADQADGDDADAAWERYRLGMVLPALAVLVLAQRDLSSPRAEQLVATSLRRILTAVEDSDLAAVTG